MMNHDMDVVLTFIQKYPDAAARELELQAQENAAQFLASLPLVQGRRLLVNMLPVYAARICTHLSQDQAFALLAEFNANQLASLLRCMSGTTREALFKVLPEKTVAVCRLLMTYPEDTVGAWMMADTVMLRPENCVADALQRFAAQDPSQQLDSLAVVGSNRHYAGQLYLRDLLQEKTETPVSQVMRKPLPQLPSRVSVSSAARHTEWRHVDMMAVLNSSKHLVGLLPHRALRCSVERSGEQPRIRARDNVAGAIGDVYGGSLIALLGLVGDPLLGTSLAGGRKP